MLNKDAKLYISQGPNKIEIKIHTHVSLLTSTSLELSLSPLLFNDLVF